MYRMFAFVKAGCALRGKSCTECEVASTITDWHTAAASAEAGEAEGVPLGLASKTVDFWSIFIEIIEFS